MLLRFAVANYLSFAEEAEFTLFPYKRLRKHRDHIYPTPEIGLLKAAVVYGANGSGKSNLVRAMAYLRNFVVNNAVVAREAFRLGEAWLHKPSQFEVEFYTGGEYYRYGISVSNFTIVEEFLLATSPRKESETVLFTRKQTEEGNKILFHDRYLRSEKDRLRIAIYTDELLKPGTALLNLLAENESFPEMRAVRNWFVNELVIVHPDTTFDDLVTPLQISKAFRQFANTLVTSLDTGIDSLSTYGTTYESYFRSDPDGQRERIVEQLEAGAPYVTLEVDGETMLAQLRGKRLMLYRVATHHTGEDGVLTMFHPQEESDGTRRVLDFVPLWEMLFRREVTVVIDEIGRSLHPSLLAHLVKVFATGSTRGQLICTTHEDHLLSQDTFRRDEIWICRKGKEGSTEVYPLSEFQVRHDLDLRKGYLAGRFGGVPDLLSIWEDELVSGE